MEGEPTTITGVVHPSPLRELSDLLGVEIAYVERFDAAGGRRQWFVAFADDFRGGLIPFLSRDFRSPKHLTEAAKRWSRDRYQPRFTKDTCRRVLWLLHLAAETSGAVFTPADLRDTYHLNARREKAQHAQRFGGTALTSNATPNDTPSNIIKMEDHR
jgi:hypothetical protein